MVGFFDDVNCFHCKKNVSEANENVDPLSCEKNQIFRDVSPCAARLNIQKHEKNELKKLVHEYIMQRLFSRSHPFLAEHYANDLNMSPNGISSC